MPDSTRLWACSNGAIYCSDLPRSQRAAASVEAAPTADAAAETITPRAVASVPAPCSMTEVASRRIICQNQVDPSHVCYFRPRGVVVARFGTLVVDERWDISVRYPPISNGNVKEIDPAF